ncbi:hypothetical protein HOG17_02780 [Candidatus Peregrinibacteria bacterium]|jgi:vancomycin resistance protein YoaR|nr:hypothetical protein [Candidatus Peregrinibacteria bacterium]MBT4148045.1 hypothetical protein [Candidatus Peregrinibacteria bacterium]MBT4366051.1 hypothetical protein [Candidatus Peregrinibacteria bacterium]MBT4455554.1 hypothetical protein [Candidatus Peregrinibacteria bacterium]
MNKVIRKTILSITLGLVLGALVVSAIFGVKLVLHGKLPPNTIIADIDVSYKTIEEATVLLEKKKTELLEESLEIEFIPHERLPSETKTISLKDIDADFFITETLQTIDRINLKEYSLPHELKKATESKEILFTFDTKKLIDLIKKEFNLAEIEPKNATFYFTEKGYLEITEEKAGIEVDFDKLVDQFKTMISKMTTQKVTIAGEGKEPGITKEALVEIKEEMIKKLNHKVKLTYNNYDWNFLPVQHLSLVSFTEATEITLPYTNLTVSVDDKYLPTTVDGEKSINISISEQGLEEFLETEEVNRWVEVEVDPISIYKDQDGQIIIDGKGRDGIAIQVPSLKKAIELALEHSISEAPISTRKIIAPITISKEIQDMGIKELIGEGHTRFSGSPGNRVHNIGVGMDRFNGTIIAPEEEFSFNTNLGAVDASTGYKKELVITEKGTIPEYGGGLCQVSTTMYRAAIFSGLPITARAPHSYAVSYYSKILGAGLDATIYLGGQDLKFVNDTEANILVNAYTDGNDAHFKFYGTSDGRTVSMEGPEISNYRYPPQEVIYENSSDLASGETKQVEKKHSGFDALWSRVIKYSNGEEKAEEIFSHYKTTQEKYLVGP